MEISPKDSEAKLIIGALENECVHILQTKDLIPNDLLVWGEALEFVYEHIRKYDRTPSVSDLLLVFPDMPVFPSESFDVDFLVDIANENAKRKKLKEVILSTMEMMNSDVSKAVSNLLAKIPDIESKTATRAVYIDDDPVLMLDRYLYKKELLASGKQVGLKTGFDVLDAELLGWMPGDLVLLIGPPEAGKSLLALKTCTVAYISGARILYVSLEMKEEEQTLRWHPIIARSYGYTFSNTGLMSGHGIKEDSYLSFLEEISGNRRFVIVDDVEGGRVTVAKIEGLVKQYSPDILVVDSLPLLTSYDGSPAVTWQGLLDVAYALKFLAIRKGIVIIGVSASDTGTFDTVSPASKGETGLSKNIIYAADVAISISQAKKERTRNLKIIKKRKGKAIQEVFSIAFDPDTGRIGD